MIAQLPAAKEMFAAFEHRDSQYEGVFYTGVRTTGIFCRPTCRARKPRRENVEFFATAKEALDSGYRPCKVCRPMEPAGSNPDWVEMLLARCHEAGEPAIRDADLIAWGLEPARVRRWFKRQHGITFHQYLRQLRINRAYGVLRAGPPDRAGVTESGVRRVVSLTRIPTPLGPMVACAADGELCLLEFVDRPMLETQLNRVRKSFRAEIVVGEDPLFEEVARQLEDYFAGRRREFDLPIASFGSDFQQAVWRILQEIPYGQARSYAQQARAIGRPTATRAVARANGDNRIGSDGSLTGYGGGLRRKRYLLKLEGALS